MSFILALKFLRSPSLITWEPQHCPFNKPPQIFAIIEDFGIQAQALLQQIHTSVVKFLVDKQETLFASEAFNLGLVWKELTNFLTIPEDWKRLGKLVSDKLEYSRSQRHKI